jgi:hypothetical protein
MNCGETKVYPNPFLLGFLETINCIVKSLYYDLSVWGFAPLPTAILCNVSYTTNSTEISYDTPLFHISPLPLPLIDSTNPTHTNITLKTQWLPQLLLPSLVITPTTTPILLLLRLSVRTAITLLPVCKRHFHTSLSSRRRLPMFSPL